MPACCMLSAHAPKSAFEGEQAGAEYALSSEHVCANSASDIVSLHNRNVTF